MASQIKEKKHPEGEILLWCQVASADILSFFKLIFGVMQLETDLIFSHRFLLFGPTTAYQPSWVSWYLIAAPWCGWTLLPSLQLSAKIVYCIPCQVNENGALNTRLPASSEKKWRTPPVAVHFKDEIATEACKTWTLMNSISIQQFETRYRAI